MSPIRAFCLLVFSVLFHFILVNSIDAIPPSLPFRVEVKIPGLFVFGDSWLDSGNYIYLLKLQNQTIPSSAYGIDFPGQHSARATNGRTMADFIAELTGLPYLPPYLSLSKLELEEKVLPGANYASSGCGILSRTGKDFLNVTCLSFDDQINLFTNTVTNLQRQFNNSARFADYISKSLFFINIGSNDLSINYLLNDKLKHEYSPETMGNYLAQQLSQRLKELHGLGARKFVVSNVFPLGCQPLAIAQNKPTTPCVEEMNMLVSHYNKNIPKALKVLESTLPGFTPVLLDVYKVFEDVFANPALIGITDVRHPCCTVIPGNEVPQCIPDKNLVCKNRNEYVFYDGAHPTEVMHFNMINRCWMSPGSICSPINLFQLLSNE